MDKPEADDEWQPTPLKDTGGRLGKLEQELYAREESETIRNRGREIGQIGPRRGPGSAAAATGVKDPAATIFESVAVKRAKRRKQLFFGIGGVVLVGVLFAAAVAGTWWYRVRQTVNQEQIFLTLEAPAELTAGDVMTYASVVRNDSHVNWQNVEITLELPKGFRYQSSSQETARTGKNYVIALGALDAGAERRVEVTGQLLGEFNATLTATGEVIFTPENFPSGRFTKKSLANTVITLVPVDVSLDATDEARNGERVLLTVQVRNNSPQALQGLYVKINPAPGIQLTPEDPQFSPGFSALRSEWELGALEPLANVERSLVMLVEGQAGERRTLDVEVGVRDGEEVFVQRTIAHLITVTASALAVRQVYNDQESTLTVSPGERVKGVINYTNVGNVGLKDVVIKAAFEGVGIDPASLQLTAGAYDPKTRTITWTAASLPELATVQPRQEGSVTYDFSILPAAQFPTTGEQVKNNVLVATATIDSPDLVTATGDRHNAVSDRAVLSVASTLSLELTALYDDGRLGLTSTGPVPPKAGEQTTYTLRFRLGSALNDLGDVRLNAVLPDGVRYTNVSYKTTGDVTFNDRTGEIVWTIPLLAGLTGRTKPGEELHVQVAITPGENQLGKPVTLLNSATVSGTDLFTDNTIQQQVTSLPTTSTAVPGKGVVE